MNIQSQTEKQSACVLEKKDYQAQRCPGKTCRDSDTDSECVELNQDLFVCMCI